MTLRHLPLPPPLSLLLLLLLILPPSTVPDSSDQKCNDDCPPPTRCLPTWEHHFCLFLPDPNRPYNRNSFLVTHNSFALDSIWMPWAANQDRPISRQLEDGVRGFMLDLWDKDGTVSLCHGSCDSVFTHIRVGETPETFASALETFGDFLEANPGEVLTFFYESYVDYKAIRAAYEKADVTQYIYFRHRWPSPGQDWPRLRDMAPAIVAFSRHDYDYLQETMYGTTRADECSQRGESSSNDDLNRTLLLVNHFESVHYGVPNMLDQLVEKLWTCRRAWGKWANFLAVNYYEKNLPDSATILAVSWLNTRW